MKALSGVAGPISDTEIARARNGVLTTACSLRTLDLTNVDTSTSLGPGTYQLSSPDATVEILIGLGVSTATLPPASGAPSVPGAACFQPGTTLLVFLAVTTTLHGRVASGTATLRIQEVK